MTETRIATDLSIVIPTLGRACLRDSVRAIATGSMQPVEIVLSHQGLAGSMDAMLREFSQYNVRIRYLRSDQRGAAAGRNAGIRSVTSKFFGTTDDDCIADFRWVEEIALALGRYPRDIITGRVLASEPGAPSVTTFDTPRVYKKFPLQGGHFSGGNFAAALTLFNDVGPFDESVLLRFCEDPEWSYRAMVKGYPIRYVPQVSVTHLHWRDDADMTQVYSQYAYSQGGWIGRKFRAGDLSFAAMLLYELARGSKRWFLGTLRHDKLRIVNGRAFVIDLLRGVSAGWNGQE
jgi:GT2 family glycosyltransferase